MKRRVALIRALLSRGTFLLLDEPFAGLDEESRQKAISLLLRERRGRTLLFTTHNAEEAAACGAKILTLPSVGETLI